MCQDDSARMSAQSTHTFASPQLKPILFRPLARRGAVFVLPALPIFLLVYGLTAVQPYAKLNPGKECRFVCFSPDSQLLVTAGQPDISKKPGPLRVWNVADARERFAVAQQWRAIETVQFSPDGRLIAAHEEEGDLKVWNTISGEECTKFRPETRCKNWIAFQFSPDSRYVVFQDYSRGWPEQDHITFWNIAFRSEQFSLESNFRTLTFAPDGMSFITYRRKGNQKTHEVLKWRIEDGLVLVLASIHQVTADRVAISPDLQRFATAEVDSSGTGEVALWDMATGHCQWRGAFDQQSLELDALDFEGAGNILCAVSRGPNPFRLDWWSRAWDLKAMNKEIDLLPKRAVIAPNGKWLATQQERGVKLRHVSSTADERDLTNNADSEPLGMVKFLRYPNASFSPDSNLVLVSDLNLRGAEPAFSKWVPAKYNPFPATASGDIVRAWDVSTGKELQAFPGAKEARFSPDGKVLATLSDSQIIELWHVPFCKPLGNALSWTLAIWVLQLFPSWLVARALKRLRAA